MFLLAIFEAFIDVIATLAAAVLSHKAVSGAIADAIVLGMNRFLVQPDLDLRLMQMNETLSKRQSVLARKAGEDFPKMVGNFIQGMMKKENAAREEQDEVESMSHGSSVGGGQDEGIDVPSSPDRVVQELSFSTFGR